MPVMLINNSNIELFFDHCYQRNVSVIGSEVKEGELFDDVVSRCPVVGVGWVSLFCSGIYYLKRGDISRNVFEIADL